MSDHGWYSEQPTIMGHWASQKTPFKPRDRTIEGREIKLRRVREIQPHEAHLDLGALRALEDDQELAAAELAESARVLVATGMK